MKTTSTVSVLSPQTPQRQTTFSSGRHAPQVMFGMTPEEELEILRNRMAAGISDTNVNHHYGVDHGKQKPYPKPGVNKSGWTPQDQAKHEAQIREAERRVGSGSRDPHFRIQYGTQVIKFDLHGKPGQWYDVVSAPGWQLNAKMGSFKGQQRLGYTWMREVAFTHASGARIQMGPADKFVPAIDTGNGELVPMRSGHPYALGNDRAEWNQRSHTLAITTAEGTLTCLAERDWKSLGRRVFNIQFNDQGQSTPLHGVIGQFYSANSDPSKFQNGDLGRRAQGGGALQVLSGEQPVASKSGDRAVPGFYEVSGPFATDDAMRTATVGSTLSSEPKAGFAALA